MAGRFLSPIDIAAAKYEAEVFNSALKRGEIRAADKIVDIRHVVCCCGATGCIFISCQRSDDADYYLSLVKKKRTNGKNDS